MASIYSAVSWETAPPSLWIKYRKSPVRAASALGFLACPSRSPARIARTMTAAATERFCRNFIGLFLGSMDVGGCVVGADLCVRPFTGSAGVPGEMA